MVIDTTDSSKTNEAVGLREYMDGIGKAVSSQPAAWVRCDLHKLDVLARYVRMDLVAPDDDPKRRAQASGGCFPDAFERMRHAFAENGLTLETGAKILVRLRAKLDANYGFTVEILDIDPTYTLGDLRTRMEAIRVKLRASGEWDRNRSLPQPRDFVRIAVISPSGAAGLGDFRALAERLATHRLVAFDYFEAPFQSADAPTRIIEALRSIYLRAKAGHYCAVAIIRGGGAAGDLTWLVDHSLIRAVCLMPVPVITGIGHERDETLLDEVACIRCHTPSMAIGHVQGTVINAGMAAYEAIKTIRSSAATELVRTETSLALISAATAADATRTLVTAADTVARRRRDSAKAGIDALHAAERSLVRAHVDVRSAASKTLAATTNALAAVSLDVTASPNRLLSDATVNLRAITRSIEDTARQETDVVGRGVIAADAAVRSSIEVSLTISRQNVLDAYRAARAIGLEALAVPRTSYLHDVAIGHARQTVALAAAGVDAARARAEAMDPVFVVAAGYAILRGPDDKPLVDRNSVQNAKQVRAQLRDGSVKLIVERTKE